ncbi:hypothetical protein BH09DEP1_BH09DEP1_2880 [soil metagenome]
MARAMDTDSDKEVDAQNAAELIALAQKHSMNMKEFVLAKGPDGYTFLHIAAHEHDVESARFCLAHGEDVNVTYNKSGEMKTPLKEAIDSALERKKFDTLPAMVEFLCSKGSKLFSRHWCAIFSNSCRIQRIDNPDLEKSIHIIAKALEDLHIARKIL